MPLASFHPLDHNAQIEETGLTKYELKEKLREKITTLSAKAAGMIVNIIFDSLTEALASGGRGSFRGNFPFQLRREQFFPFA